MTNKSRAVIFILPIFVVLSLKAQKTVDFGVKGGLSIPNLTSGDANPISKGYKSRMGVDVAVHIELPLSRRFSILPQLEYCSQGGKKKGKQAFSVPADLLPLFPENQTPQYLYANYNSVARINYLMLPILVKYRIPINSRFSFYIAAGPFVSMVVSAENETHGTSAIFLDEQQTQALPVPPQSFDRVTKIKNDLHKANTGINGHVGFEYHLSRSSIFIEGGGNYGLVSIQKDATNGRNRTGAGIVVVGYQFPINRP